MHWGRGGEIYSSAGTGQPCNDRRQPGRHRECRGSGAPGAAAAHFGCGCDVHGSAGAGQPRVKLRQRGCHRAHRGDKNASAAAAH
eukprot:2226285-Pyramimonas_sp.AAC.1